ncbi:MAG: zinc ribbon domain-containing protein, partial [Anaerolineae bacterium]
PRQAAEVCWRAAQEHRSDEDAIACYEQALGLFRECGEEASALECDRQRRFLRRWPFLTVEIVEVGNFKEGQSRALRLRLTNSGWGLARQIEISVVGKFDADQARSGDARTLQPDRQRTQPLYIIPQIAGEQLPLHLTVRYADPDDRPLPPLTMTIEVSVRPASARSDSAGQVNVYGNWIQSDTVDELVLGDQVRVERRSATAADAAAADPQPAPVTETLTCARCGAVQSAAAAKCSRCHAPFVRCLACGRHMPERMQFCIHCGQPQ